MFIINIILYLEIPIILLLKIEIRTVFSIISSTQYYTTKFNQGWILNINTKDCDMTQKYGVGLKK